MSYFCLNSLGTFPLKAAFYERLPNRKKKIEIATMSDEDMFFSQKDVRPKTNLPVFLSKSQPQKSDLEYLWNIVFQWDIGNKYPFSLQPISNFSESEVPSTWYLFKLRDDLRRKKIYVRALNGNYSIFAKVERGK